MQLFEPFKLTKDFTLKNRLVMAPMTTWSGNSDGTISEEELSYYKARANGTGMVITATTYMTPYGKGFSGQFYAGGDEMLPSLKALAETIKASGAKAILQIFHAGRKANPQDMPDGVTRSASNIPGNRIQDNVPKAMTEIEIQETIQSFHDVTKRAYKAGFDGVEIHGANTYLLQQYFSPHANRRTDKWGGSLLKRLNLPLAIVDACLSARQAFERPFLIGYRFSPEENHEPGISLSDTQVLMDALCDTNLDYLHISLSDFKQTSLRSENEVPTLKLVSEMINHRKPLIGVGSVYTKADAEEVLSYDIPLVAIGRQLLIDPESIEKWQRDEIAFTHYIPANREELKIPLPLHKVMMRNEGWVPTR